MQQKHIFPTASDRSDLLRVYHQWLTYNKPIFTKYSSIISMLFMAILIPFDFLLFDDPLIFSRIRVVVIITYALNLFFLSLRQPPTESTKTNRFDFQLIFPPLLFILVYEYFLFVAPKDAYGIVLIANYIVVFYSTFFLHRFSYEQYTLNTIAMIGLFILLMTPAVKTVDIILIMIVHICSVFAAVFFRREFVGTMYLRQSRHELQLAIEQAEASNELKNAFLSTMSHELRTPLNAIFGFTDLLTMSLEGKLSKEELGFITTIRDAKDRLLQLIDKMLDVSRIESRQYVLVPEEIIPDEIAKQVVAKFIEPAHNKDVNIIEHYEGGQARIKVDKSRFQQIIKTLFENAVKYTAKGNITIHSRVDSHQYRLTISDTGIGIKKEFMPFLFMAFQQASKGLSRGYEGAGLSLAITHHYINAMNGKIEVHSKVKEGSSFTVIFTLVDESRNNNNGKKKSKYVNEN